MSDPQSKIKEKDNFFPRSVWVHAFEGLVSSDECQMTCLLSIKRGKKNKEKNTESFCLETITVSYMSVPTGGNHKKNLEQNYVRF